MRPMTRFVFLLAATSLFAGVAVAKPELDNEGKCRDNGRFVKQSQCETGTRTTKCRDITTKKFAKCDAPNTEPVPKQTKDAKDRKPTKK